MTAASVVALRAMSAAQVLQILKPVYLLVGAEPLLIRDWLDDARRALFERLCALNIPARVLVIQSVGNADAEHAARMLGATVLRPGEIAAGLAEL